ncbi:MAG: hypothetical protein ACKOA2_03380 [Ilumatobacteraceae bacterium]
MLSPSLDTLRLFLHIVAGAIWVGGQFTLAGVVPTLRRSAPDALAGVARAYGRLAWPSFVLLVATGMWNLMEIDITEVSSAVQATVLVHVALGMLAGGAAAVHSFGGSRVALAVGGAVGALASLAAVFVGVLIRVSG